MARPQLGTGESGFCEDTWPSAPSAARKARPRCGAGKEELQAHRRGRSLSFAEANANRTRPFLSLLLPHGRGARGRTPGAAAQPSAEPSAPPRACLHAWTPLSHPHTTAQGQGCTYGSMLTGVASPITERTGGVTSALSTGQKSGWQAVPSSLRQSPPAPALGGCSPAPEFTRGNRAA